MYTPYQCKEYNYTDMHIVNVGTMHGDSGGWSPLYLLKLTIMPDLNTLTRSFPTYIGSYDRLSLSILSNQIPMLMLVLLNFVAQIFQELSIFYNVCDYD